MVKRFHAPGDFGKSVPENSYAEVTQAAEQSHRYRSGESDTLTDGGPICSCVLGRALDGWDSRRGDNIVVGIGAADRDSGLDSDHDGRHGAATHCRTGELHVPACSRIVGF